MPTMRLYPTTIRLTKEDKKNIHKKMKVHGYSQFSAFIRFAAHLVPDQPKS